MTDNFLKSLDPIDLNRKSSLEWVENSYLSDETMKPPMIDGFLSLSLSLKKIRLFYLLIIIFLFLIFIKSFWLQVLSGNYYFNLAESNRIKKEYLKAHRGIIYDRNGIPLVNNLFGFSLFLIQSELPKNEEQKNEVLNKASSITQIPVEEFLEKLQNSHSQYLQPILIRTGISYDQAILLKINNLAGIKLEMDSWRLYLQGESFSHLLGYIGKISSKEYDNLKSDYLFDDNIGKAGLEKWYEKYLRGIHGQKRIEVDALGREKKIISEQTAVAGANLILSIDSKLQQKTYEVLKEKIPHGKGSVIISNPQDGSILALVDYPSYDNNLFTGGIKSSDYNQLLNDERKPLFARSILGEYPPGSTIKPIIAAAALQEKIVSGNTTINSVGGIKIGQWFFPDWKAGGHGITNVTKAIAWSVNTYFYYISGGYGNFKGLGLDNLVKYFKLFGLDETTGIDLPGERKGFIPTAQWKKKTTGNDWYIGDTYHLSIGQGDLLVTPLQVNNYTSAIANGGNLYSPHLVSSIIKADGKIENISPKLIIKIPIDSENLKIVKEGMRETVIYGSARSLNSLPVLVAGKTGTAQWNKNKPNHAWFTGFAPYEQPSLAITVLVEEGGEGSSIAVPIAKEIISWWFNNNKK